MCNPADEEVLGEDDFKSARAAGTPKQVGKSFMVGPESHLSAAGLLTGSSSSDVELAWLNYTLKELWPYTETALMSLLKDELLPPLQESLPGPLKGIRLKGDPSIGDTPPVLGPVKYYKKEKQRHVGIELDFGIEWGCNANISLEVPGLISIGIKSFVFSGEVSLVLRPLMKSLPIVGGMQVFMINDPCLDWELTGAASLTQFPIVEDCLKNVVMNHIRSKLVLPNRFYTHWIWGKEHEYDITAMHFPMPEMLLRLNVVEASRLDAKDFNFLSQASSDPYAVVRVGTVSYRTPTLYACLSPVWGPDGWADFVVYNPRQRVHLGMYDADLLSRDDLIGELQDITVMDVLSNPDAWWPIHAQNGEGEWHESGRVHLVCQGFNFKQEADTVLNPPRPMGLAKARALLTVQLRHMRGLPKHLASGAFMEVTIEGITHRSIPSQYLEAEQDLVYDFQAEAIDPVVQRLAECLSTAHGVPTSEIAHVSGLNKQSLERVLKQKPSFTCRWHQGFHFLLDDPDTAAVNMRLIIPGEEEQAKGILQGSMDAVARRVSIKGSSTERQGVQLAQDIDVKWLSGEEHMSWEGVTRLCRKSVGEEELTREPTGPFDLDVFVCLWGMRPIAPEEVVHTGAQCQTKSTDEFGGYISDASSLADKIHKQRRKRRRCLHFWCYCCCKRAREQKEPESPQQRNHGHRDQC